MQNVEIVRDAYERFRVTGRFVAELAAPGFVWDMSHFHGWPEDQVYEGAEGAEAFVREWAAAWDDWELEIEALHDAGEKVLALIRQRGRARASGMPVDMSFAQIWTLRDGRQTRMDMYSSQAEALEAVGLAG
ncbi:MAG TPA: nuclear transport factor 2 family protein [Solirubrobacteraceae bacterium]|jgi:ketosteroid isomerase-like protein|nr:nuclear transport factor 2 family protein [Solirubrobacteraceae bacterium]